MQDKEESFHKNRHDSPILQRDWQFLPGGLVGISAC